MCDYQRRLEAYKSHTFWNKNDNDAVMALDKVLFPIALAFPALFFPTLSISKDVFSTLGLDEKGQINPVLIPAIVEFVSFISIMLLTYWYFTSFKYRLAIRLRFSEMEEMEKSLGFEAHTAHRKRLNAYIGEDRILEFIASIDIVRRTWFYVGWIVFLNVVLLLINWYFVFGKIRWQSFYYLTYALFVIATSLAVIFSIWAMNRHIRRIKEMERKGKKNA